MVHVLWAAPPEEVANLRFEGATQLRWDPEPTATSYVVYRGYTRDLRPDFLGTFLDGEILETGYTDPAVPFRGHCFFYLITATNGEGEGSLGAGRSPLGEAIERTNSYPWPGLQIAGRWEAFQPWPVQTVHATVLHMGRVLSWGLPSFSGSTASTAVDIWDPATDEHVPVPLGSNIFCAGHSFLPDGRLVVPGGQITLGLGPRYTHVFDPLSLSWEPGPQMRRGRYYPTTLRLGDERVLIFSGHDEDNLINPDVEVFSASEAGYDLELLEAASRAVEFYPRLHQLPDGRIAHVGAAWSTWTLDLNTQSWTYIAQANQHRSDGSSVLLPPGPWRVMSIGGTREGQRDHPEIEGTPTAEIIDFSMAQPTWRLTAPMRFGRMHCNAVILPDGRVLVVGGGVRYDVDLAIYPSEIFDPATESWTMAATQKSHRVYHSMAILLPDGRVMSGGSNFNLTVEFYSPGYLFRGPRPRLEEVPMSVGYASTFLVGTPDAGRISSVVLIHPGAATHSFAMDQRYVPLSFRVRPDALELVSPEHAGVAPPGHYMLFLVDGEGVPSVAKFVRLSPSS